MPRLLTMHCDLISFNSGRAVSLDHLLCAGYINGVTLALPELIVDQKAWCNTQGNEPLVDLRV